MENQAVNLNTENGNKKTKKTGPWIVRLIQGAIIGVGGIIPGISGGVLCAVFGLYEPLMEVLAHPIKSFKKHFKLILPVIIGIAVGFVALAKVVALMFNSNEALATALFVGLILGELPSLWKESGEHKRKRSSFVCMAVAFITLFSLLLFLELGSEMKITPNPLWFSISGVLLIPIPQTAIRLPLILLKKSFRNPCCESRFTTFFNDTHPPFGDGTTPLSRLCLGAPPRARLVCSL